MGDLISKQSAIEKMWELYNYYGNNAEIYDELTTEAINREFSRLQRAIENMEVAYDVEKVAEELGDKSFDTRIKYDYGELLDVSVVDLETAIEIVLNGGKG